jgi:hypothetical protein
MIRGSNELAGRQHPETAVASYQRRAAFGWSAMGFVAGIAFWHCVGFWSLVHTAVVGGDKTGATAIATQTDRTSGTRLPPVLETGSLPAAVKPSCVLLVLDRTGGDTRQAPCPTGTFHHRNAGLGVKRDREPPSTSGRSRWLTQLNETE